MKKIALAGLLIILLSGGAEAHSLEERRKELIQMLSAFFPKAKMESLFTDPRIRLDYSVLPPKPPALPKTAKERIRRREEARKRAEAIRQKLLSEESIKRGLNYLKDHAPVFSEAEKRYGVDPFVIVSILRNETNLGNYIRKNHPVLNTLYSLYVLMPRWRNFAVRELVCFLDAAEANGWDIFSVPGSNRGAFGYPQFIPCSFASFAADGDDDGKIDLFNHADAIMSVARYLSANGWSDRWQDEHRAILRYNPYSGYRDLVLEYREKLLRRYFTAP